MKNVILTLMIASTMMLAADGADLYKKCAGCHGANGEKVALGKSKVIQNLTQEQLKASLTGYKDGSYGGSMKSLMKGQVAALNAEQIDSLSAYIAGLK